MKNNWFLPVLGVFIASALTVLSIVVGLQTSRISALDSRIQSLEVSLRTDIRAINTRIDTVVTSPVITSKP